MNSIKDILEGIFDQPNSKLETSVRLSNLIKYLKDAQIDKLYKNILLPHAELTINNSPEIIDIPVGFYGIFAYTDTTHDTWLGLFYRKSENMGYEICLSCECSVSHKPIHGADSDQCRIFSGVSYPELEILKLHKKPLVIWTKKRGDNMVNMLKSCRDIEWSEY